MNQNPADWISDWSWSIIERSDRDPEKLRRLLWELSPEELERLESEILDAASRLTGVPHVSFLANAGYPSEDAISDIAECTVWRGREVYHAVLEAPPLILHYFDDDNDSPLTGVIDEVLGLKEDAEG